MTIIEKNLTTFKSTMTFAIPYDKMNIYSLLHQNSHIIKVDHLNDGIKITCEINKILGAKIMAEIYKPN